MTNSYQVLMLNIKGSVYMGVMSFASLRSNPSEAGLWMSLGLLSLIAAVILWHNLKVSKPTIV